MKISNRYLPRDPTRYSPLIWMTNHDVKRKSLPQTFVRGLHPQPLDAPISRAMST